MIASLVYIAQQYVQAVGKKGETREKIFRRKIITNLNRWCNI